MNKKSKNKKVKYNTGLLFENFSEVNISSNREAVITGINGVIEYTSDLIRLTCNNFELTIKGNALSMSALSYSEVIIRGLIFSVEFG